ncbi:CoA-binding protein [Oceanobacillus jordanicus]|uniref:CoA-binding protein n=1 Tax=Oceanobacillus jordanicus TaxID=2867266 RepID=A0AAW5B3U2_9BACI|nr:CoA-binding protein [Oceanobacillus jordanicus]MCG3418927.1 CoA-binding protein [Oceanobacillus jordanicus]
MTWENPSNEQLKQLLTDAKTLAVVGLSDKPERTSYQISEAMQKQGYRIIPVNPTVDEVLGEKSYSSLQDVPDDVDIINVFRRPEHLPAIAEEAAQTNCKVFWAQQGIVNQEAYDFLKEKDFTVIMDLCIKVVHAVLVKG